MPAPHAQPPRAAVDPAPGHPWLTGRSIQIIEGLQERAGAYPACPTFSAYRGYAWLRDGAFTAEAMSRWGHAASADRFHRWVARVFADRRAQVDGLVAAQRRGDQPTLGEMLPARFTLHGAEGTDDWWNFQTDGYGTWLWALNTHARRHAADLAPLLRGIEVAVDYLTAFGQSPCYDWWEENPERQHTSTLAAVRAGLLAAADMNILDPGRRHAAADTATLLLQSVYRHGLTDDGSGPRLAKWLGGTAVDASLAACIVPLNLLPVDDPIAAATIAAVAATLDTDGGVHRYPADVFYGGGQWPLLSCLLGWNQAAAGDTDAAWRHLHWAAAQATPTGELPEQTAHHLLHPEDQQRWIDRWGPVARPLLWSHAMYLILADELGLNPGHQP